MILRCPSGWVTYGLGVDVDADTGVRHRVCTGEFDEVRARRLSTTRTLIDFNDLEGATLCNTGGALTVMMSWAHSG